VLFGSARSGQMIMVALVLMVGSFYAGSIFGNNSPIYISQPSSSNSSSSSPSQSGSLSLSLPLYFFKVLSFSLYIVKFPCFA
jgi:hypothetical protein